MLYSVKQIKINRRGAPAPFLYWGNMLFFCFECGPDHKKNFLFRVKVAGTEYQPAVASANKKQAKADAASLALQKLGILPP